MSVGKSKVTPFKQEDLQRLLSTQIRKAECVWRKHHTKEWYKEEDTYFIDGSAGDMDPCSITSPQIFLDSVIEYRNMPTKLYLTERKRKTFEELESNYQRGYRDKIPENMHVLLRNAEMEELLKHIAPNRYRFGLLYFDPNGFQKESYEAIFSFLRGNPRIDVILNINIAQLNRNRPIKNVPGFTKYDDFYLTTIIESLNKESIWIRDNIELSKVGSTFHWVMLFGTNMPRYDIGPNGHFKSINSLEGQKIIQKYNLTTKEKEEIRNAA